MTEMQAAIRAVRRALREMERHLSHHPVYAPAYQPHVAECTEDIYRAASKIRWTTDTLRTIAQHSTVKP